MYVMIYRSDESNIRDLDSILIDSSSGAMGDVRRLVMDSLFDWKV